MYNDIIVHFVPINLIQGDGTRNFLPIFKVDVWFFNQDFIAMEGREYGESYLELKHYFII